MRPWCHLLPLLASLPSVAFAEDAPTPPPLVEPVRPWSTDLVDPAGLSRFHLITRATFGDGRRAFSGASVWSYEGRVHFNIARGLAMSAVAPLGLVAGRGDEGAAFMLGNLALGVTFGRPLNGVDAEPMIRLAGGFDVYAPTATDDPEKIGPLTSIAAVRSYESQLYIPRALSFRLRVLGEVDVKMFAFAAEIGLVPVVSFATDADGFAFLFSGMGRVSATVTDFFEPYLELGGATQIAGDGEIKPPFLITPGLRFHVADVFDPAVFVSFNFVSSSAVVFGIDLAFLIRPSKETKRAKDDLLRDDF